MGLFNKFLKKEEPILQSTISVSDDDIVAIADGELFDVATVSDPVFAQQLLGESVAFRFVGDKVTLCSPANGTLCVLFPTYHAFGVTMKNGIELLVHIGVNTVEAKGNGFKRLSKKQGDIVMAGDPIVEFDLKELSSKYDMSTMLIVTNPDDKEIKFIDYRTVKLGEIITK